MPSTPSKAKDPKSLQPDSMITDSPQSSPSKKSQVVQRTRPGVDDSVILEEDDVSPGDVDDILNEKTSHLMYRGNELALLDLGVCIGSEQIIHVTRMLEMVKANPDAPDTVKNVPLEVEISKGNKKRANLFGTHAYINLETQYALAHCKDRMARTLG
jgi:hypothetical protein